jgi:RimJ/RimL family protein N-acetyltransferase
MAEPMTAPPPSLTIRAFRSEDIERFIRFRSHPTDSTLTYGGVQLPESPEEVRSFVESARSMGLYLWVWADADDTAAGFSVLSNVDRVNWTLWTGSAVFDAARRGQGLGSLGRRTVLDFVFNEMNFRRIYGEFADFNDASRRSHLKLGAELIGGRRQVFFVSGRYHDSVVYTVWRERFNELFPPDPDRHLGRHR